MDLDETLVHSSFKPVPNADYIIPVEIDPGTLTDVYVLKRPFVDYFMETMGEHYEIVVFTASLAKYADPLLDLLDVHNVIRWRLFRESCYPFQGNYVKDLTSLGRPLERTIILDNSPHSYAFQPMNALPISSFIDDPTDTDLLDATPLLVDLATVADVAETMVANDGYLPRMRYSERGLPTPRDGVELSRKSDLGLPNSATDGSTRSAAVDASVYEYSYSYTSSPGWRVEVLDTCIIVIVL